MREFARFCALFVLGLLTGILRSYGELASGVVVAADILAVKAYPTANLQKAGPKVVQAEVLVSFPAGVHAIAMPSRYARTVAVLAG